MKPGEETAARRENIRLEQAKKAWQQVNLGQVNRQ